MKADCGAEPRKLLVDGGMTQSDVLLQLQSNLLGVEVHKPSIKEVKDITITIEYLFILKFFCFRSQLWVQLLPQV